ncbi:MAG: FAD-binding oxidoreductase [Actinomycetota bacterium]
MSSEAVVVGAGICGASAAYHLAAQGVQTLLVERSGIGSGATGVAPGLLCGGSDPPSQAPGLDVLKSWAQAHYEETLIPIRDELPNSALRWTGALRIRRVADPPDPPTEPAPGSIEIVSARDISQIDPSLHAPLGGSWFPEDGNADAPAIARAFVSAGVATGKLALDHADGIEVVAPGGAVTGLRTTSGTIDCSTLVVATGSDERGLLARLGPELAPVRGQLLVDRGTPHPRVVCRYGRTYAVARGGCTLIGATEERLGFDTTPDHRKLRVLAGEWGELMGRGLVDPEVRTGFRSATSDGAPLIGRHPGVRGLYIASGLYRDGVLLGPAAGAAITRVVTAGVALAPWDRFDPARLIEGAA